MPVITFAFDEVENIPHAWQATAVSLAVETYTPAGSVIGQLDPFYRDPGQAKQQRRIVLHSSGPPVPLLVAKRDSGGHKTSSRRRAVTSNTRSCPTEVEESDNDKKSTLSELPIHPSMQVW